MPLGQTNSSYSRMPKGSIFLKPKHGSKGSIFLKPEPCRPASKFLRPSSPAAVVSSDEPLHLRDLASVIGFKCVARRAAIGAAIGAVISDCDETDDVGGQGPKGAKRK